MGINAPLRWPMPDGSQVSCREKLRVLEENHAELAQVMQDAFEDAVLIGVDAETFRTMVRTLADGLRTPLRP